MTITFSESTLIEAHKKVLQKVNQFDEHKAKYDASYMEAHARVDFIDWLFTALGWDVKHEHQLDPYAQEVAVERSIKKKGKIERPDYTFFLSPNFNNEKFFCEAKRPFHELSNNDIFQAARYGWSAKTPLAILTNFESLLVIDCRNKPDIDTIQNQVFFALEYLELRDRDVFAKLYYLISREAVHSGSLERFAATQAPSSNRKGKQGRLKIPGSVSVDDSFLADLKEMREDLSALIYAANTELTSEVITEVAQKIIDRLIFLRFLEDKGIESEFLVESLVDSNDGWQKFKAASKALNDIYNGVVFKPHRWIDGEDGLMLSSSGFSDICFDISSEKSPYNFCAIPIHILGDIYEQFLGTAIEIRDGRVFSVFKNATRKSSGVYYTPEYIVRNICENTIGELIKGKTPSQIAEMRFADIACGSGSFLISAYDILLRHHEQWYNKNPDAAFGEILNTPKGRHADKVRAVEYKSGKEGLLRLTLDKKRSILLKNIFGIDIDQQAVEVAQLSLFLKLLEDENEHSRQMHLRIHSTLLPSLSSNIKCGNALISPSDIRAVSNDGERGELYAKLKPFDYGASFNDTKFDVIVGNPPYFSIDDTWKANDVRLKLIKHAYPSVHTDKTDILFYFLAKAAAIAKSSVGMIVSRAFLEAAKASKLRAYLSENYPPYCIIDFQDFKVFDGVGITTAIVLLKPKSKTATKVVGYKFVGDGIAKDAFQAQLEDHKVFEKTEKPISSLSSESWHMQPQGIAALYKKIDSGSLMLGDVMTIGQGMQTGANDIFSTDAIGVKLLNLRNWQFKIRANNSKIQRYEITSDDSRLIFIEKEPSFDSLPPGLQKHLLANQKKLEERAACKRGNCEWWKYTWPLKIDSYGGPKLLCPYMASENRFAYDETDAYLGLTDTSVLFPTHKADIHYMMGLLNSKLLTFRFKGIAKPKSGGVYEYFENSLSKIPIRLPKDGKDKKYNELIVLVKEMLKEIELRNKSRDESSQNAHQNVISSIDFEINRLVYSIYGLSECEIEVIENLR